jgi:hypothetical protein
LLSSNGLQPALPRDEARSLVQGPLAELFDGKIYPSSIVIALNSLICIGLDQTSHKRLLIVTRDHARIESLEGRRQSLSDAEPSITFFQGPRSDTNARWLSGWLPFLTPTTFGIKPSAGCGDRLGEATPGHLRALRKTRLAPILAQQSVRENERTGREPLTVLSDAMWGVLQEGWRGGFGADADHLKTESDIDDFAAAGFTFFTIDPGEHVNATADQASASQLAQQVRELPWDQLDSTPSDLHSRLVDRTIDLGTFEKTLNAEEVQRAAAKYGHVIAYTTKMYHYLLHKMGPRPFELEVSVDETDTVTTLAEHIYIASELNRLGVRWVSLAPRYVGDFEKGVDYIGDLQAFEASFAQHAAVANAFGPYKLSLHSGSDKFSIYPIVARLTGNRMHLKTAGTSYLEALRTIAQTAPALFRRIAAVAMACYPQDRASYHVSAEISRIGDIGLVHGEALIDLLDNFDARQILHVTYGSVLNHPQLREAFFTCLRENAKTYSAMIEKHFDRHLAPFSSQSDLKT